MKHFHSIRIAQVFKETVDCAVLSFDVPDELKSAFAYRAGQYLTLRAQIGNQDVRRSYSLCSSPLDNEWKVAVKKIDGGLFSTYANEQLKAGDILEVMPPEGSFTAELNPNIKRNYVFFAAGSGITPILSLIKTILAQEPLSTCKVFYLNRNVKSIIFKDEIENLKNSYFQRLETYYFLTKEFRDVPLFNGRFTDEKLDTLCTKIFNPSETDAAFICGPESMIFLIRDALQKHGMDAAKIHFELFGTAPNAEDAARIEAAKSKLVEGTEVTIIDGGKEFHFIMPHDIDNVLDGALAAGADLPFACKGGVCSTCRCKVVEGSVEMKLNYSIEEADLARNYVLSCQAVPTSKKLIVDFDI
jgi:ring-1,2-phenylacetyl-CoA epoxidase subunit PaaE